MNDIYEQKLKNLIKKRDEFLAKNPQLRPLQKEIDSQLDKAGDDPLKRQKVISDLMMDTINNELKKELKDLVSLLQKL